NHSYWVSLAETGSVIFSTLTRREDINRLLDDCDPADTYRKLVLYFGLAVVHDRREGEAAAAQAVLLDYSESRTSSPMTKRALRRWIVSYWRDTVRRMAFRL